MGKVSERSYFLVQSWMVTKLGLKSVERDCYAIIYGYSQDGESEYHGSLAYMAELTGYSRQTICNALKSLVEKDLILKEDYDISGVRLCKYRVNLNILRSSSLNGVKESLTGVKGACTNNIYNIDTNISKDTSELSAEPIFEFGMPDEKPKQNLYQKCASHIYSFTEDHNVQKALFEYLDFLLEKSRSEKKPIYENQWKGLLKKLKDIDDKVGSIQYSIQKGYVGFYEPPTQFTNTTPDTNKAAQHNSRPEDWARNADGSLVVF